MRMVDVGAKDKTERTAIAECWLRMSPEALSRVRESRVEKGDVFAAAKLAAIMAAKQTPSLLPLCHPLGLTSVELEVEAGEGGMHFVARVKTCERTGVEMEALTAVSIAALTAWDMLKSTDKGMCMEGLRLLEKSGGRSGHWKNPAVFRP
ncbi:MAG: cyclic pyranopterin monophosphate synthase MoaC [Proteobacteria bacterium]|nr:cyclic pyranopterin monophosphate synthase MoaC [Cystobacterineae bacterium]MCL2258967.1 cyclic pyranopterin monophosphate synthase MoaC [Cystobacterineae bacterium]MCL2314676.1 cyclic pyranopterin monophosphate synthase MoaC [Pseudomonadota bacterium]